MTIRPAVVLARLRRLSQVLDELERMAALAPEERESFLVRLAMERAVHVAAEAIFDVGHHVLAGRAHAVPPTYREVPKALAAAGVFTTDLSTQLAGLAGLRNLLVHDYGDVDHARLWHLVATRLGDLRAAHDALAAIPELNGPPA